MAPALPWLIGAGVGMQAIGQYQQGVAAQAQAKAQATVAEYNARVSEQQAKAEEQAMQFRQRKAAEEASRYQSALQAGLGASGVVSSAGTPLMIQARQVAESELENLMIGYEGMVGAQRARSQASLDRLQASIYKQQGKSAYTAGIFGAGTSLLTGFGQLGYMMRDYQTPTTYASGGRNVSASSLSLGTRRII